MSMRRGIALSALGVAVVLALAGCEPGVPPTPGVSVVWPKLARAGDTVAVTIDSNYIPDFAGGLEKYNLSRQNVQVSLGRAGYTSKLVSPRAVVEGALAPPSRINRSKTGARVTVVLFDVPTSIHNDLNGGHEPQSPSEAYDVNVTVSAQGLVSGTLRIAGGTGQPTAFATDWSGEPIMPALADSELEFPPTLRLRPHTSSAWDQCAAISSVEFVLQYPSSVGSPKAFSNSDAADGMALVGPPLPNDEVRVLLLSPNGFQLNEEPNTQGDWGQGPILDVTFDPVDPNGQLLTSQFEVRDLVVSGVDGTPCLEEPGPCGEGKCFRRFVDAGQW